MPVALSARLHALQEDVGSQAAVADLLDVHRSRVSRWLRGGQPDSANRAKVIGLEFVLSRLLEVYERDTALEWLRGFNAHLGNRRPIDLLREGRALEVAAAIEQAATGSYA
jgi:transcriptional regulator with XRE-family HTH domain